MNLGGTVTSQSNSMVVAASNRKLVQELHMADFEWIQVQYSLSETIPLCAGLEVQNYCNTK